MANKLTTMGYFIKRLRDSGYMVDRLYNRYSYSDPRAWSVVIDPESATIFCTCYINHEDVGESYFEIYDGGQYIPSRWKIKTNSIEVFITQLTRFGIINKTPNYNSNREVYSNNDRT